MASIKWNDGSDLWTKPDDWTFISTGATGILPGPQDTVTIDQGNPDLAPDPATPGTPSVTVRSIDDSAALTVENGAALHVLAGVVNSGTFNVDAEIYEGGSTVQVDGSFVNTGTVNIDTGFDFFDNGAGGSFFNVTGLFRNGGSLSIGNADLKATTTIRFGSFANTGTLTLIGNTFGDPNKATLDLGATVAPTTLRSTLDIVGNAELDYRSGTISSIGATGELALVGALALINAKDKAGPNSALALRSNAGVFGLSNGAVYTVDGTLTNTGTVRVGYNIGIIGITNLTVSGGGLTVTGSLDNRGTFGVDQDTGATAGYATIDGSFTNSGTVNVDTADGFFAWEVAGGGSLHVGGRFINRGALNIGNNDLNAPTTVTVGQFVNTGTVVLTGNGAADSTDKATFDTGATAAPSALATSIAVSGAAELDYASGVIRTIAATGSLSLAGAGQIDVKGAAGSNSALALTRNAGTLSIANGAVFGIAGSFQNAGTLAIDGDIGQNDASLTVAGSLVNTGAVNLDLGDGFFAWETSGGGSLTVDGAFVNKNALTIGNNDLNAPTTVRFGSLVNTGRVSLTGNGASGTSNKATLDAGATVAPTTLTASLAVSGDAELDYASGAITAIGAAGNLSLAGAGEIDVKGAAGHNTALALARNAGTFSLSNGASYGTGAGFANSGTLDIDSDSGQNDGHLSIGGAFTNTGAVNMDQGDGFFEWQTSGGGMLAVAGAFDNAGTIMIGTGDLNASDSVSGKTFSNSGSFSVTGNSTHAATVAISGAATDSGMMVLNAGSVFSAAKLVIQGGGTLDIAGGAVHAPVTVLAGGEEILEAGASVAAPTIAGGTVLLNDGSALTGPAPSKSFDSGLLEKTAGTGKASLTANLVSTTAQGGTIEVTSGTLVLGGALTGHFSLEIGAGATLILDKAADAGAAASLGGAGSTMLLRDAQDFDGTIAGFSGGDTLDLNSIHFGTGTTTTLGYSGDTHAGIMTVSDGTNTASLSLVGSYTQGNFHLGTDLHGGSAITFA